MRWGITFLAWVCTGLWLVNGCVVYVGLWQNPPPGFSREQIRPHLETCGRQQGTRYAYASVGFVAFYYGSGWLLERRRKARKAPDA